jgi:hypothetical protein
MTEQNSDGTEKKLNIIQVFISVFWAIVGVQSDKVRERDFKSGNPKDFILVGLIATTLFVLTIYAIVRLVLSFSGM